MSLGVVGCASSDVAPGATHGRSPYGSAVRYTSHQSRRSHPLTSTTTLAGSAALRIQDGRKPVPPHLAASFASRAPAHGGSRYAHPLTSRTNSARTRPYRAPQPAPRYTAPPQPRPSYASSYRPAPTRTTRSAHLPPTRPSYGSTPARSSYVPPARSTYVPPRSSYTPSRSPSVSLGGGSSSGREDYGDASFNLSSVPSHLRDLNSLQQQERRLGDESSRLSQERRALLRVSKELKGGSSQEKLQAAYAQYQSVASVSRGLSLSSGWDAFRRAEPAVRDRLDQVNAERRAVNRMMVAIRNYQSSPSAAHGADLKRAVEKFHQR